MSVRSSSTDHELAHALAVAGLLEIEELVADIDQPSMSSLLVNVDFAREILESLSPTDQQILVLHTAGYSTAEIAIQLDFANAQVVATKMGQIRTKLQKAFGSQI